MIHRDVDIIAHRGASFEAPENTLAAVRLAWSEGADAVEVDITLTGDGHVVVLHDPTTGRIASRDLRVDEVNLEELQRLDVGSWKGERWRGERVPTLDEVLATVPSGKCMFIELKCGVEIGETLGAILSRSPLPPDATVLIGQDLATLAELKRQQPGRPAYLVASQRHRVGSPRWRPTVTELIGVARDAGLDGLDLRYGAGLDADAVKEIHAADLSLFVWTVNSGREARRLREMEVDGITTDRPGWLRAALDPGRDERNEG